MRNVPDFGRVFLMLKYTDITQNTYVQSWTVTEIMAREKCVFWRVHALYLSAESLIYPTSLSVMSYDCSSADGSHKLRTYCLQGEKLVQVAVA